MDETKQSTRLFLFMCLFAIWIAASGYSVAVLLKDIGGEADVGLSGVQLFFGWQGIAGMFALAIFGLGFSLPKDSGSRSLSVLPILATLGLCGVVFAMQLAS